MLTRLLHQVLNYMFDVHFKILESLFSELRKNDDSRFERNHVFIVIIILLIYYYFTINILLLYN